MITRYVIIAALLAALGGAGWIVLLQRENSQLQAENGRLVNKLSTCSARVRNIVEDMKDDAKVGNPSDFPIPDDWLLP